MGWGGSCQNIIMGCFGRSNHVFWVEVLEAISPWEVGCVVRDGAMSGNPQGIFELY